jgi:CRISPR/Cas system-associated exonuclease Cas4 (RecB family)
VARDWLEDLLAAPPAPAEAREDRPDVSASEIAAYMFCGRSWWLRRETGPPVEAQEALNDGERRHALAGQAVEQATRVMWRVVTLALVGAVMAAIVAVALLATGGR